MLVKRRRARLLEIAQGNDADAELRKLASIGQRNAAQVPNIRSVFMPGGAPRDRLDSGPGQRCMRLSSHVLCGLDWGTRRLFPNYGGRGNSRPLVARGGLYSKMRTGPDATVRRGRQLSRR